MITYLALIMLYWDAPTQREDGTAIYSNEIAYYEMYHNGSLYLSTEALQMDVVEYGDYEVRAIDTDGQISEFSNVISYPRVKGKPGAPGQLRKMQ